LVVAILAAVILKEPFTWRRKVGFALIVTGAVGIVWGSGGSLGTAQNVGHLLFLGSAFSWACYTVALRRARLDGLSRRCNFCGWFAAPLLAPLCLAGRSQHPGRVAERNWPSSARSGAPDRGYFVCALRKSRQHPGCVEWRRVRPSCPAMTALMAIPILGEWPSALDWTAIAVLSLGVYVVTSGSLPAGRASGR